MLVISPLIAFGVTFMGASCVTASEPDTTSVQKSNAEETSFGRIYNILILGEDEASGLDDVLLIVSCDTKSKTVNALQIPRDTYAEYTEAAYRKLNGAKDSLGSGRAVADFLFESLGVEIDRYITVGLEDIGNIVDILGGVEIDVPFDMSYSDPYQGLSIDIKKGKPKLDGEMAKEFVRYRSGYKRGDLDRLDAQKLFLAALVKKISKQSNIFSVLEIAGTVLPKTETDITYEYCFNIIKELGIPAMEKICFVTLPGEDIQGSSGAWYYVMNRRAAYKVIKERFNPGITENEFDVNRRFTSND